MDPDIFDRRAVRQHRDRAARSVGRVGDVLRDAAERLLDRLDDTTRQFGQALDGNIAVMGEIMRASDPEATVRRLLAAMT